MSPRRSVVAVAGVIRGFGPLLSELKQRTFNVLFPSGNPSLSPSPYHRWCAWRASHRHAPRMPSRTYSWSEAPSAVPPPYTMRGLGPHLPSLIGQGGTGCTPLPLWLFLCKCT